MDISLKNLYSRPTAGFYLGNYSVAQCMFWGLNQGCAFVSSRCGTRRDDETHSVARDGQCQRHYKYSTTNPIVRPMAMLHP